MNLENWKDRISHRTDISASLVHLTKGNNELKALDVLMKILKERTLRGSSNVMVNGSPRGFICGDSPVVCFQDVPLYSLSENILHEQRMRKDNDKLPIRYLPFGLKFSKNYIFKNGGRPVIYEKTETAKQFLPKEEYWRIVRLDMNDDNNIIDWTHEREWRIKGDFNFDIQEVEILLSNQHSVKKLYSYCKDNNMMDIFDQISGIVTLQSLIF